MPTNRICSGARGLLAAFAGALLLFPVRSRAQSVSFTATIDASAQGGAVNGSFAGLSYETGEMKPNNDGADSGFELDTNTTQSTNCWEVLALAENMDLRSIRIGGDTVDELQYGSDYGNAGITALFNFAHTVGLNVIFSLRLQGDTATGYYPLAQSVAEASYVWSNYQKNLDYFAIGNEVNYHSYHTYPGHTIDTRIRETETNTSRAPGSAYPSYSADWITFANAVNSTCQGNADFGGPDQGDTYTSTTDWWNNGSTYVGWTQALVEDRKNKDIDVPLHAGLQHYYVQTTDTADLTADDQIDDMLSSTWVNTNYPAEYANALQAVGTTDGWHYRFTETNDCLGGISGASNAFASALWALDYMDWQVQNNPNCLGVNFETLPLPTRTIYWDSSNPPGGSYHSAPKAAAIKMFGLSSPKNSTVYLIHPAYDAPANVTCYAFGNSTDLYVTIINKTCAIRGDTTSANVTLAINDMTVSSAQTIEMQGSSVGDASASGATVGGQSLDTTGVWSGTWSPLSQTGGHWVVTVGNASATLVHFQGTVN